MAARNAAVKMNRVVVQRTLEHLKRGTVVLGDHVTSLSMNTHIAGNNNLGARHFLFEHIPQLKFKSPHVKFDLAERSETNAVLTLQYRNGDTREVNCTGKSSSSILEEVRKLCDSQESSKKDSDGIDEDDT